jgi:two-component system OmpR family sensor kinase
VFERFYRVDKSRNKLTGGMGIGLSITKAIVEAHGGAIAAESEAGQGAVFFLTLPVDNLP